MEKLHNAKIKYLMESKRLLIKMKENARKAYEEKYTRERN